MNEWERLFSNAENSALIVAERDVINRISDAARKAKLALFRLDLSRVAGKRTFLKAAAESLGFPNYFGANWDAFEDCLTDLSWHEAEGYVLLIENVEDFANGAPGEIKTARSIFEDAAEYWKGRGVPFFVILAT